MVVTKDPEVADKVVLLRNYGERERSHHHIKGFNSRLDELQAAILLVKLRHLNEWNSRRGEIASAYQTGLDRTEIVYPQAHLDSGHVYHLFVIRVKNRDRFQSRLRERGIDTLVHYPVPIPRQPAYSEFAPCMSELSETDRACREVVSLPMFPEMQSIEVKRVIEACREAY